MLTAGQKKEHPQGWCFFSMSLSPTGLTKQFIMFQSNEQT